MKRFLLKNKLIQRVKSSPKAINLFRNSFWSILGATLSKGLLFVTWVIVARILDSDGYGQFGIIRSTVLMFTTFAGFGLGITASKHVSEFIQNDKVKTGKILGLTMAFGVIMGLLIGITFFFLSPWLATNTLKAPEITGELKIASLILFFSSLNGAQIGALQGFMSFKIIAKINVIQSVVSFPLFILGAIYGGVYGTIWAFAFSYILICLLSNYAIKLEARKREVIINYRQALDERSLIFSYSLPAFLSGLMVTPVKWYTDSLLVSQSGFSEMGIFTAALTFNNIILVGAGMLSAPFISIMARDKNNDENSNFSRFNILGPWAIGIFIASPFLIFPELGGALFGKSYQGESFNLTFAIIMLYTVIIMFKQGLGRIMIVHNLQWWSFFSNLLWGCILITCFLFVETKTAGFLAISYLVAYVVSTVIVLPVYYKRKIIPLNTIETLESFIIWALVILITFIGYFVINIYWKILLLIVCWACFILLFKKCFQKS
ncbi:oligosaccharide flippase family protein [Cyclobacterium sediminis]